jgi:hypothetical protein
MSTQKILKDEPDPCPPKESMPKKDYFKNTDNILVLNEVLAIPKDYLPKLCNRIEYKALKLDDSNECYYSKKHKRLLVIVR